MGKKVIVAGHACVDITPVFPPGIRAKRLEDVLSPGRLVHMNGVDIHTGGAVSNTDLAMKLLGGMKPLHELEKKIKAGWKKDNGRA